MRFDVAIIGGGAAGVLCAIHLLRLSGEPLRIGLIEKAEAVGEGIAYATRRAEHVLNVPAGRMSAVDGDPTHFVRHLDAESIQAPTASGWPFEFVERRRYAQYLRATLEDARARSVSHLEIIRDDAEAIEESDDGSFAIRLRSGGVATAAVTLLALGNWPRALPAPVSAAVPPGALLHGWNSASIAGIDAAQDVLIVGAGLSMVDAVLSLAVTGHAGTVHVVSRHALFPLPHAAHGHLPVDIAAIARAPLDARMAMLRERAREAVSAGQPWQWLMDGLRSENSHLWQSLSPADQRRFLRHVVRYWDVHRHRVAPSAAATVEALLQSGRLVRHAGRVVAIDWRHDRADVQIAGLRTGPEQVMVDRIVNCTGMEKDTGRVGDTLAAHLLSDGLVRRGAHGIGFDTAADGALVRRDGQVHGRLFTLGSVRIGQLWESVAIPELRAQAARLAEQARSVLTDLGGNRI